MSSKLTAITAAANAGFRNAGDKIEHLLGQALQLDAGDPNHIPIAMEMARTLVSFFSCSHCHLLTLT